ncbi:hypothetical protein HOU96_gp44 [Arthrobacter phage Maja]|uniref:Uncharacterized protein n=1 Tax=Arthrobacter phage Maja TaxID=2499009 RepID=A0A3S9UNI5_9CAUD|nr:hypothetical protein HOU96_gp44 [Arthrobacter phage Maja]AZS11742.1 hypothetical protein PBI_MAJA_44 [Arthrobacter phage Maja]
MYRCKKCGHHHIPDEGLVPCMGTNYDDEGGISRCGCRQTNKEQREAA